MKKLPDLEGLALFAKVVETRSFVGAAAELGLSKATVSKAITRLENRLATQLFHRTSRRLSVTDAGLALQERASRMLAEAQAAEDEALSQSASPRGRVRLAAPMSFGIAYVAPALPAFLKAYPDVSVDLHLSDDLVDLIGGGFDLALRIAALPDSSLLARRLCAAPLALVGSPDYFARVGRPGHPRDLADHACLGYAYLPTPETWRFTHKDGEEVSIRPRGRMRANNAEALTPALLAGLGLAIQPAFSVWRELADGRLEAVLTDWSPPPVALNLVAPPGGPRPARVSALMDHFQRVFTHADWAGEL